MATLILRTGQVVSIDRLAEAIWGDHLPPTARNQVVICVSSLRKALADAGAPADLLGTNAPGYVLNASPDQVDSLHADRLAARARAAEAAGDLAEAAQLFARACGLWRGPILAGMESSFVEGEARRLEDRLLTLTEERLRVELALGRHRELADDLAAFVEANPLRELLRAQLMLAQYRSGRRAAALDTYRAGREHLIAELGIEPGTELRELHEAILNDSPELTLADPPHKPPPAPSAEEAHPPAAQDPAPAQLLADVPHFTGRAAEVEQLDTLLEERSRQGLLTIVLITGIGGVGKSGLAVHWAHRVAHRFPDGQLFADMRGYDLNAEPLSAGAAMDRFLRAFGVRGERIPEDLDERAAQFRTVIGKRRVLVLLDNVRMIEQVKPLLPGSGQCCVIVTSRDPLGDLIAQEGATEVRLDVLGADDSAALLTGIADSALVGDDPNATGALGALCDGLPLALRIVGAKLTGRSYWTPARLVKRLTDERRRLDELSYGQMTVRASFALSYRDLSPDAARMFRRLGLLSAPDFAAWAGAALLDIGESEAEDLIEQLVDAQILEVVGRDFSGQIRYRFHDLVRLYARERAQAEEDPREYPLALSRTLSAWLALAEEAHEREYGGAFTQLHSPVERWRPCVPEALVDQPLDWLDAERSALVAAVSQAAALGLHELCWDLAVTSTTLFEARSYFDDWRHTHEVALSASRAAGDRRGEAAILCSMASMYLFQQLLDKAGEPLDKAVALCEEIGEPYGLALALRNLSLLDRLAGRFGEALDGFGRAKEIFARVGDRYAEAHVLGGIAQVHVDQGRLELAEPMLRQALEVFRELRSERGQAQILNRLGEILLRKGRLVEAESACEAALVLVRERRDVIGQAYILCGLGEIRLMQERPEAAAEILNEALIIARQVRERFVEAKVCLALGALESGSGRPGEAARWIDAACAIFAELEIRLWRFRSLVALGEVLALQEKDQEALAALESSLTHCADQESAAPVRELIEEIRSRCCRPV
ncbi:AfsR/SARP family transcriptional regulator [Nonomuraea soli]|uniref:DNA-binding SARP family transcriptional activator n=1 Tax=Nonomuraea soli TaxID=1032476 RepID=A0A7W0CSK9_9ACTN|nr:BTAD domain-containing putative transcriptional regulator [Nonomuraea soli]MBA2896569.1 DNA-binding SARP family transcriptional activator [Nonomuraea soli]